VRRQLWFKLSLSSSKAFLISEDFQIFAKHQKEESNVATAESEPDPTCTAMNNQLQVDRTSKNPPNPK
jgi:hypothetical protein